MLRTLLFTLIVWTGLGGAAFAQADDAPKLAMPSVDRVTIDQLNPGGSGQEVVELTLRVLAADGEPIGDLRVADLRVWQSDEPIDGRDLELMTLAEAGRPLSSVFVLDRSASVSQAAFDQGVRTALNFAERASRGEQVAVVAVGDPIELVVPFGTPPRDASARLRALTRQSGAGAPVYAGVLRAIELLRSEASGSDGFVVLLSAGDALGSTPAARVVEASAGREGEARIPVFTLADVHASAAQLGALRVLAEETGATSAQVNAREFGSVVNRIWRQMSRRYLLRFPAAMDGRRHRIDVEIEGKIGSAKAGYPSQELEISATALAAGGLGLLGVGAVAGLVAYRRWPRPARLVVLTGAQAGNVIPLGRGCHRIGSLPENEVHLASPGVSRHHAEITVEDSRVQIRDLESKNGTRVNGVKRQVSPLLPGDRLEFADVRVVFEKGPRTSERKTSER